MKGLTLKEFFEKKYNKELRKTKKLFKKHLAKGLEKYYSTYTDDIIVRFNIKRIAKGSLAVTGSITKKNSICEERWMRKTFDNISYKDLINICTEILSEAGFAICENMPFNTIEKKFPFEYYVEGYFS